MIIRLITIIVLCVSPVIAQNVDYLYGVREVRKIETSVGIFYYQASEKINNKSPGGWNGKLMFDYRIGYPFLVGAGISYFGFSDADIKALEARGKLRIALFGKTKADLYINAFGGQASGLPTKEVGGGGAGIQLILFGSGVFLGLDAGYRYFTEDYLKGFGAGLIMGF